MAQTVTTQVQIDEATADGLSVIDFWAPWCGPCKMMEPVLDQLEASYGEKIHFLKMNVDDHQEIAEQYKVMSIPSLVVFKNGKAVEKVSGYYPKEKLANYLQAKVTESELA
ncbi:thioredoxin [Furfurilactobacillus siliginis]|uniref:Thioredoxin n=1 Tax=Furfurilactobacillus siliginis TaxID=348151 RepID=A0A0R2L3R0_9LACO|nr:thioredoxin [Furfurilactobacillus siliginis]KRN96408.1 trxA protein [Furfurilactobacillus siliginis]GEK29529.1 thioredoxin [Furfurilactobacillus siliginis]